MSLQINTYFQRVFSSDVTDIRNRERPTPDTKNPKHCTHGDFNYVLLAAAEATEFFKRNSKH